MVALFLLLDLYIHLCKSCDIQISSPTFAHLEGVYEIVDFHNNRPLYRKKDSDVKKILFHYQKESRGKWLLGQDVESDAGWAYTDNWAITLNTMQDVAPNANWLVNDNSAWKRDKLIIRCVDGQRDKTVFLYAPFHSDIHGLYLASPKQKDVWHQVSGEKRFQMWRKQDRWIVGDQPMSDLGIAFVKSAAGAKFPGDDQIWSVNEYEQWMEAPQMRLLHGSKDKSIYYIMRKFMSVETQESNKFILNNGLPASKVGLGTGGLRGSSMDRDFMDLLIDSGYTLIDSAAAYESEEPIGYYLETRDVDRRKFFITTKIWYDSLGFEETRRAFANSLRKLQTSYVDNYMIHWPACHKHISWMDCSTASKGTWQESWEQMQQLYAEGLVLSLGVSNFNLELMREAMRSPVPPAMLQNHFDLRNREWDVLKFCADNGILYQAYATLRNLHQERDLLSTLETTARKYGKSAYQVANKMFVDAGIGVIPRTANTLKLRQNIEILEISLAEGDNMLLADARQKPKFEL